MMQKSKNESGVFESMSTQNMSDVFDVMEMSQSYRRKEENDNVEEKQVEKEIE